MNNEQRITTVSMKDNVVAAKSRDFAIRIIKVYKYLAEEKKEYILSKQILRSGTSIGANVHEGDMAISKADFISKLHIALKEANETLYWLDLLHETDYLTELQYESLNADCKELLRLLTNIIKTAKQNLNN